MGFTPREIDGMTMWEFQACLDGYVKANSGGGGEEELSHSRAEHFRMMEKHNGSTN